METIWFILLAFMLTMYVLLDGFDLGAGIVHLIAGKTEEDRRKILKAVVPYWDGNEVWLIAAGGTLYFAFPLLYASSFSGFYLPLMMVLWLLMLRGLGIEFRHQVHHTMWVGFWDVVFCVASILLAVFFGAALGNVVRGVPMNAEHYFFEPLWTTFTVIPESGILDWYTVLLGLVALCTLTTHGALYVAYKTDGDLRKRLHTIAMRSWWGVLATSILALIATTNIRPAVWANFAAAPWGYIFPVGGFIGLFGMNIYSRRGDDTFAFAFSSIFIASMLATTAFGLYPNLLPSSNDPSYGITIQNSAAASYGLGIGLVWWSIGMVLAIGYFIYVHRMFKGKVTLLGDDDY